MFLARNFASLQNVLVELQSGDSLVLDLRILTAHNLLIGNSTELAEQKIIECIVKKGTFAIDIGAHCGIYTVLLARLVGTGNLWAFEPQPDCLPSLRETVARLPNTRLFPVALSEKKGEVEFYVAEERSMSGLSNWTENSRKIICQTNTLDELLAEENRIPDFIKCDIEGAELLCFRGANKTLDREQAPILLFEANEAAQALGFEISDAFNFLKNLTKPNYSFFEIHPDGALHKIDSLRYQRSNILAVPQSKIESLRTYQN
jgi:FkbM family methyltransferase